MSNQPLLAEGTNLAARFQVGERIAMTAVGQTYKALDGQTGKTVVLKALSQEFSMDADFGNQFVTEGKAATKLKNPAIAAVLDAGIENGVPWIATEYVEGQTLEAAMGQLGKIEPERALQITQAVAGALAYAESEGIVHRQISPTNILLTTSGDVKIVDFGFARMADPKTAAQTAAVMGTATYISPEQARGEKLAGPADVYALGVVFYQMLSGKPPFSGDSPVAVAFQHVRENPAAPNSIATGVPAAAEALALKMLAKNPAERPTAEEVRKETQRQLTGAEPSTEDTQIIKQGVSSPTMVFGPKAGNSTGAGGENNRRLLIAGIAVAVALIAVIFYFVTRTVTITVPNVTGTQVGSATSQLEALNLTVSTIEHSDPTHAPGTVLQQIPGANSRVVKGTSITLTVASETLTAVVPSVVGMPATQAESALTAAGLTVGTETQENQPGTAPGTVVDQTPAANETVDKNSAVDLVVAAGRPTPVPDVTCLPVNAAAIQLQDAGLQMAIGGVETNDLCSATGGPRIARQDPASGTDAGADKIVTVWTTAPVIAPSPTPTPTSTRTPSPSPSPKSKNAGKTTGHGNSGKHP